VRGENMFLACYNPKEMLKEAQKLTLGKAFLYLLLGVILWFFAVKIQGATWLASFYVLLGALVLVLVGSLVLNLMMLVLGKNDYSKSLITLVTPWVTLSKLVFVAALLALIPVVGVYLVALLLVFVLPFIMIVQIKLFMDLFKVDLLTSVVVLFILGFGSATGFAALLGSFAVQFAGKLGFGLLPSIL